MKHLKKFNESKDSIKDAKSVCNDCGNEHGTSLGHERQTWWTDNCDICGEFKDVTSVHNFNYLRKMDDEELERWRKMMSKEEFESKFPYYNPKKIS